MTKLAALVLLSVSIGAAQMKLDDPNKQVKGTLAPVNGGTGQNTFTKGDILCALSSSAFSKLNVGSNGKILTANSAATCGVEWANPAGTGTVTSVVAGNGLTGGTITSSGTIAIATANKTRTCHIVFGTDDAASDLTTSNIQPQHSLCLFDVAATILQITVKAAGGTPNIIISKNHAGTQTALLSSALATGSSGAVACSNAGGTTGIDGTTTCSATLQNTTVAAGDYADATGGATSTGAKWLSVDVTFTVN